MTWDEAIRVSYYAAAAMLAAIECVIALGTTTLPARRMLAAQHVAFGLFFLLLGVGLLLVHYHEPSRGLLLFNTFVLVTGVTLGWIGVIRRIARSRRAKK